MDEASKGHSVANQGQQQQQQQQAWQQYPGYYNYAAQPSQQYM